MPEQRGNLILFKQKRPKLISFGKYEDGLIYLLLDDNKCPTKEDMKQILDICLEYQNLSDQSIEEKNKKIIEEHERYLEQENNINDHFIIKKTQKPAEGFIYFLQDKEGRVKIGKAKNLINRIFSIGICLPNKPVLIYSFKTPDTHKSEKELHNRYSKQRLNGEWFNLTEKQIKEIKSEYKDEE